MVGANEHMEFLAVTGSRRMFVLHFSFPRPGYRHVRKATSANGKFLTGRYRGAQASASFPLQKGATFPQAAP